MALRATSADAGNLSTVSWPLAGPGVLLAELDAAGCPVGGAPRTFAACGSGASLRGLCCDAWSDLHEYIEGLPYNCIVAVVIVGRSTAISGACRCPESFLKEGGPNVWRCLEGLGLPAEGLKRWQAETSTYVALIGARVVRGGRAWVDAGHRPVSFERWLYAGRRLDFSS